MLRLAADVETSLGRHILEILKRQYSDQAGEIDLSGTQIGHMMVNKAKKELQGDYAEALDAVQNFMIKIVKRNDRPEFDFRADSAKGSPGAKTWKQALNNILNNVKTTAMSQSMSRFRSKKDPSEEYGELLYRKENQNLVEEGKRKKLVQGDEGQVFMKAWSPKDNLRMKKLESILEEEGTDPSTIKPIPKAGYKGAPTKSIDQAFGTRGEDGGDATGGEGRMPTGTDTPLGRALDDQAAIKQFMDLLDEEVPHLRNILNPEEKVLFDLIFYEDEGGFGSDIKENMNQASRLKEKLLESESGRAVVERNEKRWSGFVGDTRKKLLLKITDFVENILSPAQSSILYDTFFGDTTEGDVDALEMKKESEKEGYQLGIDKRKIARYKFEIENGTISDKDKKSYDSLVKKLKSQGIDVDAIVPAETPEGSAKTTKGLRDKRKQEEATTSQQASIFSIAARISVLQPNCENCDSPLHEPMNCKDCGKDMCPMFMSDNINSICNNCFHKREPIKPELFMNWE
jgi:hypothetical protein